jgi:hypothetical protein
MGCLIKLFAFIVFAAITVPILGLFGVAGGTAVTIAFFIALIASTKG